MASQVNWIAATSLCNCLFNKPSSSSPLSRINNYPSVSTNNAPLTFKSKPRFSIKRAAFDEKTQIGVSSVILPNPEVEESVEVLKKAAKSRKVEAEQVLAAMSVIQDAKIDTSNFLETLGGTESPGRTWMLIFTAEKKLKSGRYFPLTAVQRFDAAGKRIENGVYLGKIGSLTFEGRLSWKKKVLAFIFERIRVKVGPLKPLEINIPQGQDIEKEPSTKNPFFIWFYVDEEIAVARGKSGGTAFWCRCSRVAN